MSIPLVTAVIPIRDAADHLVEAIESVRSQTFRDWELVLVDDGSRDGSERIAREYAAREPARIRYREHPGRANRGSSASRNLGVAGGRGEWLAFLDADDVWRPEKLERQLALAQRFPEAAMLYNPTLQWYSWTGRDEDRAKDVMYDLSPLAGLVEPPSAVPLFVTESVPCPCTCSYLIRRTAHDAVGGSEASFPGMYDDQVLVIKIHLRYPVYVAGECLDWYRIRPGSTYQSALRRGSVAASRLRFLDWLDGYLRRTGALDAAFLEQLGRERARLRRGPASRAPRWLHAWWSRFERLKPQ